MPQLRSKVELAQLAEAFATVYQIVEYKHVLYMPVHFLTREPQPTQPDETVWIPLDDRQMRGIANIISDILFATPAEESSYRLMVSQFAMHPSKADGILVRIKEDRVMLLTEDGTLVPATGDFVTNYLDLPYDPGTPLADELFGIIAGWLNSEEQAHSLLYHLATMLQPRWSARKYLLLIGEGYNGKGTLVAMIHKLIGEHNISKISRQDMSAKSTTLADLNGKLMNIIYDGPKEFLKDSSTEKTLVAGEPISLRVLYETMPRTIQTFALFVEALNEEPLVSDKSPALQKRLARFSFPNVYPDDRAFGKKMKSDEMVAALLHLMLAHWVNEDDVKDKLQLTAISLDLQLQAVWSVSPIFRYLEWCATRDAKVLEDVGSGKMIVNTFLNSYRAWLETNGYRSMEDDYLLRQLNNSFKIGRKTVRVGGKPTTQRVILSVLPDTQNAINLLQQGGTLEGVDAEELAVLSELDD
jgi:hypothetical protein